YHRRNPPLKPNESIVRTTARCRGGPRRLPTTYCQIRLSNRGLGRENVATVRLMRAQTLFDCGTENPIGGQRARGGADWSCVKTMPRTQLGTSQRRHAPSLKPRWIYAYTTRIPAL